MFRRADFSQIFIFEKSWSKSKHAFRPKDVTVGAHMLSLSAWAWQRLCDVLSARESRDGTGCPPTGRAIGTLQIFLQIFCAFLRDSGTPIFQTPKRRRKICGKSARKSAQKSAHQNLNKNLRQESARQKSAQKWAQKICAKICAPKICAENRFEHSVFWKMEARKKRQKESAPNLCKTRAPT